MAAMFVLFVIIVTNTGMSKGVTSQIIPMVGQQACEREANKLMKGVPNTITVVATCIQTN